MKCNPPLTSMQMFNLNMIEVLPCIIYHLITLYNISSKESAIRALNAGFSRPIWKSPMGVTNQIQKYKKLTCIHVSIPIFTMFKMLSVQKTLFAYLSMTIIYFCNRTTHKMNKISLIKKVKTNMLVKKEAMKLLF